MRHPVTAAVLAAGLLAAPAAALAQAPQGPPPAAAGPTASDPGLDALHARKAALLAKMNSLIARHAIDPKFADHIKFEVDRMNSTEAGWRQHQTGKVYPNQLASLNKRMDEIEAYAAKAPPPKA